MNTYSMDAGNTTLDHGVHEGQSPHIGPQIGHKLK